jgi:micrococcal nuclease
MSLFTYAVQVKDVYDGDTLHLDIDLGFNTWRRGERYRLARINAPELKTPEGPPARDHLILLLTKGPLIVTTSKADNYGRYLVECEVNGLSVNDQMVADGFAVKYP